MFIYKYKLDEREFTSEPTSLKWYEYRDQNWLDAYCNAQPWGGSAELVETIKCG